MADGDAPRVLVVDDEPNITDLLATALGFEGFRVETTGSAEQAMEMASNKDFDIVILDIMLPDLDGTEACRRLRGRGNDVPILFLTALDATRDKIEGFEAGGDDYLTKPFSIEELVARIRAVLKRSAQAISAGGRISYADLVVDSDTHEVFRQGKSIELTAKEFELLEYFALNARRALSKEQILDAVWGMETSGDLNIVETYVSYLRKKIDVFDPPLIQTIRGVGYALRAPR